MSIKRLNMSWGMALAVAATVGLSVTPVNRAHAQQELSYAAKFVCKATRDDSFQLLRGAYGTVINIHNPHAIPVTFSKRAVVALTQRDPKGEISPAVIEKLLPGEALGVDCEDISRLYSPPKNDFIDGYLVLRVPVNRELGITPELDVVGVYTAKVQDRDHDDPNDVESIAVETYQPKVVIGGDRLLPDLTIRLTNGPTTVSCPAGQGSCMHKVQFDVINASSVPVGTPFDIRVATDSGLVDIVSLAGIAANGLASLSVTLGPGNNCYDPNCLVKVEVDSGGTVVESDENNNTDSRLDIG